MEKLKSAYGSTYAVVHTNEKYRVAVRPLAALAMRIRVEVLEGSIPLTALREELKLPGLQRRAGGHASTAVALPNEGHVENLSMIAAMTAVHKADLPRKFARATFMQMGLMEDARMAADAFAEAVAEKELEATGMSREMAEAVYPILPKHQQEKIDLLQTKADERIASIKEAMESAAQYVDEALGVLLSPPTNQLDDDEGHHDEPHEGGYDEASSSDEEGQDEAEDKN